MSVADVEKELKRWGDRWYRMPTKTGRMGARSDDDGLRQTALLAYFEGNEDVRTASIRRLSRVSVGDRVLEARRRVLENAVVTWGKYTGNSVDVILRLACGVFPRVLQITTVSDGGIATYSTAEVWPDQAGWWLNLSLIHI